MQQSRCEGQISGHISRDSTTIEAREKPEKKEPSVKPLTPPARKKGRPRKGELPKIPELSRVQKQGNMSLEEMLKDLPISCNYGSKKNSQGFVQGDCMINLLKRKTGSASREDLA